MPRCTNTENLEVHHKNRSAGNGLGNAQILCQDCHGKTSTYGQPGDSPPPFSVFIKGVALKLAGNRCECDRDDCH
jgi:hypothetical protein